jgi:hypothetical protein
MRNTIVARFVDAIGQAKIAVLDMAGNYDKISHVALEKIKPDLAGMGMELTAFYIENISLPPEVEQALDKRTQMGVLGNLDQYTKYQAATAIPDAAKNPGGLGGIGASMAVGVAMGNQMAGAMQGAQSAGAAPPPLPGAAGFFVGVGGAQTGPFDMATLAARVRDGSLTRETLVWKQGMAEWTKAEKIAELEGLFAAAPPPLPK